MGPSPSSSTSCVGHYGGSEGVVRISYRIDKAQANLLFEKRLSSCEDAVTDEEV
jgi:hypothetical protein